MTGGYLERPAPSGLADVVEIILDKGLVIDAYVRISLLGIELLTVDARIVVASVDTYLRFAEATNRLDLADRGGIGLTEAVSELGGRAVEKVASNVVESRVTDVIEDARDKAGRVADTAGAVADKAVGTVSETAEKAADLVRRDRD